MSRVREAFIWRLHTLPAPPRVATSAATSEIACLVRFGDGSANGKPHRGLQLGTREIGFTTGELFVNPQVSAHASGCARAGPCCPPTPCRRGSVRKPRGALSSLSDLATERQRSKRYAHRSGAHGGRIDVGCPSELVLLPQMAVRREMPEHQPLLAIPDKDPSAMRSACGRMVVTRNGAGRPTRHIADDAVSSWSPKWRPTPPTAASPAVRSFRALGSGSCPLTNRTGY